MKEKVKIQITYRLRSTRVNACGSAALPTLAVTLIEDLFPREKAPIAQGLFF
jgi:hypothetical protein